MLNLINETQILRGEEAEHFFAKVRKNGNEFLIYKSRFCGLPCEQL